MEELNERGKAFVNEWCNETHSTTKRIPNQHYLLEEKALLQPLPKHHYYVKDLQKRKISPDSYISINGNKYSVPVKYVGKNLYYRINYGFRLVIYNSKGDFVESRELMDGKHLIRTDAEHYAPIAKKVATSIPQIRRDFTSRFSNGARYLDAARRKFDQPTHHARKIMELQELYDDEVLDHFIGIAVDQNKMDIKSFKELLRDYNRSQKDNEKDNLPVRQKTTDSLTRDCSYYEEYAKEALNV